jgi:hypothetical protein
MGKGIADIPNEMEIITCLWAIETEFVPPSDILLKSGALINWTQLCCNSSG